MSRTSGYRFGGIADVRTNTRRLRRVHDRGPDAGFSLDRAATLAVPDSPARSQ